MRGQAHDLELRAVVIAALLAGSKMADLARQHAIPAATILSWRDAAILEITQAPGARARSRETLVELVSELVSESVRSLTAQARIAGTDSWVKEQGATGLSEYRGVEYDRIIRLLAAFRPVEPERDAIPATATAVEAVAGPANDGAGVPG